MLLRTNAPAYKGIPTYFNIFRFQADFHLMQAQVSSRYTDVTITNIQLNDNNVYFSPTINKFSRLRKKKKVHYPKMRNKGILFHIIHLMSYPRVVLCYYFYCLAFFLTLYHI